MKYLNVIFSSVPCILYSVHLYAHVPQMGIYIYVICQDIGEEEDIGLLVQSGTVDWGETGENEDPAILWALKTHN